MADKLTPKQEMFCKEYLIDLNATQAAIRAGYSENIKTPKKYYVYALVDPRIDAIFYIGKGKGKRVKDHFRCYKKGIINNKYKHLAIHDIVESGCLPIEMIINDGLEERQAYLFERYLILKLKEYGLTNIANGISDNENLCALKSKVLLSKLKPFTEWLLDLSKSEKQSIYNIWGDTESCYKYIKNGLQSLAYA